MKLQCHRKAMADVRYSHRFYAEFAKEAMQDQSLGGTDVLMIKWAMEDADSKVQTQKAKDQQARFVEAVKAKKTLREVVAKSKEEKEKAKIEKLKQKQNKFYEKQFAGATAYDPAAYQEYKAGAKTSQKERQELTKERGKIAENCAKLNEVLQRISSNYQEN
jgi:hypothetical protein